MATAPSLGTRQTVGMRPAVVVAAMPGARAGLTAAMTTPVITGIIIMGQMAGELLLKRYGIASECGRY